MDRDFLKGLDLDKETVNSIMAEHGKDINELKESKKELESKLTESAATIADLEDKLKGIDTLTKEKEALIKDKDSLAKEKETLTGDLDKIKADFGTFKMRTAVEKQAASLGAKDSADILNFVDFSSIKETDDGYEGIKEAVEGVKEAKPYLFEGPSQRAGGLQHDHGVPNPAADDILRDAMGLPKQK